MVRRDRKVVRRDRKVVRRDRKVENAGIEKWVAEKKKFKNKNLLKSKLIQRISSKSFGSFHENKITYIPIIQINREKKRFLFGNSIFLGGPRLI